MAHVKRVVAAASILSVAVAINALVASQAAPSHTEWRYFGGNKAFTRYSALDQINRDNVSSLRIAWRRPAVNAKLMAAFPDLRPTAYLRCDADRDRRRALHAGRTRARDRARR